MMINASQVWLQQNARSCSLRVGIILNVISHRVSYILQSQLYQGYEGYLKNAMISKTGEETRFKVFDVLIMKNSWISFTYIKSLFSVLKQCIFFKAKSVPSLSCHGLFHLIWSRRKTAKSAYLYLGRNWMRQIESRKLNHNFVNKRNLERQDVNCFKRPLRS